MFNRRRFLLLIVVFIVLLAITAALWILARQFLIVAATLLGVLLAILVLWLVPRWQVRNLTDASEKVQYENETRKTIAQILGGVAIFATVYYTAQQVFVTQEGQITDRFTRATDQLGSNKLAVRVGGIYAFRRIAGDSEEDSYTVVGILTTFVRQNVPRRASKEMYPPEVPQGEKAPTFFYQGQRLPADVKAALEAIVDISRNQEQAVTIDLHGTNLEGANLGGGNFPYATLFDTDLQYASAIDTNLAHAYFWNSNLRGASFMKTDLRGADFRDAQLKDTNFCGSDLRGAKNLTTGQLKVTVGGGSTILSENRQPPPKWDKADACATLAAKGRPWWRPWWTYVYLKGTH